MNRLKFAVLGSRNFRMVFFSLVFVGAMVLKLTFGLSNVFADNWWIAADTHGSLGNNQYNQNCAGRTYTLTMYGENSFNSPTYTGFRTFGLKFAWDSSSPTYGTFRSNYSAGTIGDTSTPNSPLPSGVSVSMSPVSGTYSYPYSSTGSLDTAIATLTVSFSPSFNPAGPEFPSTGTQTAFYPILYVNNDPAFYSFRPWSSSQMYIYCNKPTAPPAPLNLTATAVSQSQINLSWNASAGATSYKVFRGGVQVGSTASTSYSDTGLTCNTLYSYTVKASSAGGDSANSNTATATTFACPPGAFSISVTRNSATQNFVSWGSATNAVSYDVYRNGVYLTSTGLTRNYTDNSEFCGHQYNYQVRANGSGGTTTWNSNGVVTTGPWACVPLPGAFTLTATTFSQTAIDLSWTASSNAVTYEIRRQGVLIASQPAVNPRTYRDSGLACNTSYNYQVKAINVSGSTDSNTAFAVTLVCSPGAFTLTATTFSQTQIDLSWTASTNAVNYEVYRGGVLISTVSAVNPRTYADTGRTCGTAYSYQVKATNASTPPTTDSNIANATTSACTPPYPGTVTLTSVTETCVNDSPAYDIAWSDTITAPDAPATNYIVEVTKVSTGQKYTQTVSGNLFTFSWTSSNQLAATPPGTIFNYSPEVSTAYSFKVTGVKTGFLNGVSGTISDSSSASCSSCAVNPPLTFSNLAPGGVSASVADDRPDFSWTSANDTSLPKGGSGTITYTLKVTPQGQSQLPDVTTTNSFLTWAQAFAVWSGSLGGLDHLTDGLDYTWYVVADNICNGSQSTQLTSFTFTAQNLSAWLQANDGSVSSYGAISLDTARPAGSFNANGSVMSNSTITNFNTSSGWIGSNGQITVLPDTYFEIKSQFASRSVTTSTILPNNGVYRITTNVTLDSGSFTVPSEPTVVLIDGDLTINSNINLPNESDNNAALILIVDGNVNVASDVTQIDAFMIVGGIFDSKYDSNSTFVDQLNVFGGLVYFGGANFKRIIDPALNPGNAIPAEQFTYDPRVVYLFSSESILGVSRTSWQELVP